MVALEQCDQKQKKECPVPIYFDDRDVVPEVTGLRSALIVPCNMCPAVTLALRENEPFMQLHKSFLKSAPFEKYVRNLQARLGKVGVKADLFRSTFYHQWFMCMWTAPQHKKLRERARQYDAVIVLGCVSATETVRDAVEPTDCKVVEGMEMTGIMNAKLKFHLPANISFEDCKIVSTPR